MTARPPLLRVVLAVALALGWLVAPAPARADPGELVTVTITGSTPVVDVDSPAQVVELSGTILNTSARRIRYVNVSVWAAGAPLTTEADLTAALQSDPSTPVGFRPAPQTEESGHVVVITGDDDFAPGDRARFTVRATVAELGLTTPDAAYVVGVQVRGIPEDQPTRLTVGRGRILVAATSAPVDVAQVVQLSAPPSQGSTGDFLHDDLAGDLTSRLGTLLAAAEAPGTTALVDPALLAAAEALGRPHTVAGQPRQGVPAAADWARRVRQLARDGRVLRLTWGNPDLPAVAAAGRLDDVLAWSSAATAGTPLAQVPWVADLGPHASANLVDRLTIAGVSHVFAENARGGRHSVRLAPEDQPGMGPGGRETTAQRAGRRAADLVVGAVPPTRILRTVEAVARAADDALPIRLVAVPRSDDPDTYATADPVAPTGAALLARIDELNQRSEFLADLTQAEASTAPAAAAAAALSRDFATEAAALEWVAAQPVATVELRRITLTAAKQFVMGSRTNNFPITVTNGLPWPVTVRLVFASDVPQRINVPPTDLVTLEPGEVKTVNIAPQASSNGVVRVRVQFETRGGQRFGDVVPIEIAATDLGRVGWIIIIVSGAVVLGGTFLRIRAVQAERAKESSGTGQ